MGPKALLARTVKGKDGQSGWGGPDLRGQGPRDPCGRASLGHRDLNLAPLLPLWHLCISRSAAVPWALFAASNGKSCARYPAPESGRPHDAVLNKAKISARRGVLQVLFTPALQRFGESVMDAASEQTFDGDHES